MGKLRLLRALVSLPRPPAASSLFPVPRTPHWSWESPGPAGKGSHLLPSLLLQGTVGLGTCLPPGRRHQGAGLAPGSSEPPRCSLAGKSNAPPGSDPYPAAHARQTAPRSPRSRHQVAPPRQP